MTGSDPGALPGPDAFFHLGDMLEAGDTEAVLMNHQTPRCRDFITGA